MKKTKTIEEEAYESFMDRLTDPIPPHKGTTLEVIRQMRITHRKELSEVVKKYKKEEEKKKR